MHELLLFASVPTHQHEELLQQLAGLTAMQPRHCLERRLIFKAYRKPGLANARVGASQDLQSGDLQRVNKMLNGGMFYTQVVGPVHPSDFADAGVTSDAPTGSNANPSPADPDTKMDGTDEATANSPSTYDFDKQSWKLEFRDIPEAGTRSAVTARVMASAALPHGDIVPSMNAWGYSFVTEYLVEGDMFVHNDIVIYLHRVLHYPNSPGEEREPRHQLPAFQQMSPLEKSGSYVLQASITVQDGSNQETMKTASQHLFGLREQLKSAVRLEMADRLSLDTRAK
ncbi:mediator of RNA polymerase II transcription subunit 18 [Penicillium citrinum]|uniref:Mediator of RNA polymerase II transcription subunit 18 n=2 Tax=Penicillium TaxID=5073 RepID=A0A9W9TCE7_PENCI|nr:mediator of RNA polymerase II transcription subunit 18 [Penicillium citrinum]KAJ5217607.1 mediator of RNA polymerase II transcription subunit 18 [Penicillium citrinum]KAJ5583949.1 mediator of RNA polymerase II transcription subunit 18 [Penicillium hetheringtonii]